MKRREILSAALPLVCAAALRSGTAQAMVLPGTSLGLKSVPNLRDIGGYPARNGATIRYGVAFRSEKLNPIAPADQTKLAALGLVQVFDLRTTMERARQPDQLPPGAVDTWLDVMADTEAHLPTNLGKLLADPKQANAVLGDGKVAVLADNAYRQFVVLPSARRGYGKLFTCLAGFSGPGTQLYHCTAGKDRTGWATAALFTLLGVPKTLVYRDYLRTNDYIMPEYQPAIDHFVAHGGDPAITSDMFLAKTSYLDIAFAQMHASYGTIENYFDQGLGVNPMTQQRLARRFLTA